MAKNVRTSKLTAQYQYNVKAARYIDADSGRFVARQKILDVVEKQVESSQRNISRLGKQLQREKIDLQTWRDKMLDTVKTLHTAQYVLGQGGWHNLDASDYGRIGNILKKQAKYLNGFVRDIQADYASPKELDGRFQVRAQMYARAARPTFAQSERIEHQAQGFTEERRVLNPAEHCDGCIDAAAMGWQPIGTLPAIGATECNIGCKCDFEYR